ncbi:MAG: hypothetical protein K9J13_16340 [Saprospiraceae bacterium]|nr:hypothetical protein [Saprospiraceae bacterium]
MIDLFKWVKSNYLFFIIILIGIILRFVWAADMEWKTDEKWMFEKAQEIVKTGDWRMVGMRSGGGIVNPGMSLWIFAIFSYITSDPVVMVRIVMTLNVLAILGFLFFIYKRVDSSQKEIWLWGIALAAVSPLAVLFARKVWAQDVLPLFTFLVILGNSYRHKRWGAFLWGIIGALLGQFHMSGFFFAFGLFAFSLFYDYKNKQKFKWQYWIAGSIIGSLSMIPWLRMMFESEQATTLAFSHIFQFNFFLYWFIDSLGLNLMYSLRSEFWEFIKYPFIFGKPTYLIAVVHLLLVGIAGFVLKRIINYVRRSVSLYKSSKLKNRLSLKLNSTDFYLLSILLGLGIFMSLSGLTIHPHYLIVAFPFSYIFIAKMLYNRKKLMLILIAAQLILTISFLVYIHINEGAPKGDYCKTYKSQIENEVLH